MNEYLILKDAAAEIGVDPSYLRKRISQGKLEAEKFGGRDWWIQRSKLHEFDGSRRPVGRPINEEEEAKLDPKKLAAREYIREYQKKRRAKS